MEHMCGLTQTLTICQYTTITSKQSMVHNGTHVGSHWHCVDLLTIIYQWWILFTLDLMDMVRPNAVLKYQKRSMVHTLSVHSGTHVRLTSYIVSMHLSVSLAPHLPWLRLSMQSNREKDTFVKSFIFSGSASKNIDWNKRKQCSHFLVRVSSWNGVF